MHLKYFASLVNRHLRSLGICIKKGSAKIAKSKAVTPQLGAVIAGLLFLSAISLFLFDLRPLRHSIHQHELSKEIVFATSRWARERGLTVNALNAGDRISPEARKKIHHERKDGDDALERAMQLVVGYKAADSNEWAYLHRLHREFENLRKDVDKDLSKVFSDRTKNRSSDWLDSATKLIAAAEVVMPYSETKPSGLYRAGGEDKKLSRIGKVQYNIWKMSELAGQERAIVGGALSRAKTVKDEASYHSAIALERKGLLERHEKIDILWKQVVQDIGKLGLPDSEIEEAIENVDQKYFVEFKGFRDRIIRSGSDDRATDGGLDNWYDEATNAINSILTLEELLGKSASSEASKNQDREIFLVRVLLALIFILVLTFAIRLVLVTRQVWSFFVNVTKWIDINKASDDLLDCVGGWALERGVLYSALLLDEENAGELDDYIKIVRSESVDRMKRAGRMELDHKFMAALCCVRKQRIAGLEQLVVNAENCYATVLEIRLQIDRALGLDQKGNGGKGESKASKEALCEPWREAITNLNRSVEELHLVSLHSGLGHDAAKYLQEKKSGSMKKYSVAVKHMIWIMSEYAGRERALVGGVIAVGKVLDPDERESISLWRRQVDQAWKAVKEAIGDPHSGKALDGTLCQGRKVSEWRETWSDEVVAEMEQVAKIVGRCIGEVRPDAMNEQNLCNEKFVKFRCDILHGDLGSETIGISDWIDESTKSIDAVLRLSKAVGKDSVVQTCFKCRPNEECKRCSSKGISERMKSRGCYVCGSMLTAPRCIRCERKAVWYRAAPKAFGALVVLIVLIVSLVSI